MSSPILRIYLYAEISDQSSSRLDEVKEKWKSNLKIQSDKQFAIMVIFLYFYIRFTIKILK